MIELEKKELFELKVDLKPAYFNSAEEALLDGLFDIPVSCTDNAIDELCSIRNELIRVISENEKRNIFIQKMLYDLSMVNIHTHYKILNVREFLPGVRNSFLTQKGEEALYVLNEYFIEKTGDGPDIDLENLSLTADNISYYNLAGRLTFYIGKQGNKKLYYKLSAKYEETIIDQDGNEVKKFDSTMPLLTRKEMHKMLCRSEKYLKKTDR